MAKAQENFHEIFEKATVAIFVHDMETGRVLAVNQKASEMTGFSKEELTAAHPADISSGNTGFGKEEASRWMQKAISEGPQLFEWQGRHKDGTIHWIEVSLTRATINGKERLLAFFHETGDSNKDEDLARMDEARAIEFIKDYAILRLDKEGKILTWNAGAERIKGYKSSEIIGKNFSAFYTPEDIAKRHPEEILRIAAVQGRFEEQGWRVRKDGSQFFGGRGYYPRSPQKEAESHV